MHTVRDGRDAASSVTTKTWGPARIGPAIDWWADRLRAIEDGVRGEEDGGSFTLGPGRLHTVVLDDLVGGDREPAFASLLDFCGVGEDDGIRAFFDGEMGPDAGPPWTLGRRAGQHRASPRAPQVRADPRRRSPTRATTWPPRCSTPTSASDERAAAHPLRLVERHRAGASDALDGDRAPAGSPRPPVRDALGCRPGRPRAGVPGGVHRLVFDAGRRQRLALVAAPAGKAAHGLRGGCARRHRLRRRAPLSGADRRAGGGAWCEAGVVPAADVEARLEPRRARARVVLRRRPGARRVRRERGPRAHRRAPRGCASRWPRSSSVDDADLLDRA